MTIIDLNRAFSTEEKCREYLKRLRWPDGVTCPRCRANTVSTIKALNRFECSKCFYQFTATAGTIFHDSHLPLEKWFLAAYLMCESRKGVSANQLKRVLGVSYKTAWYLCHRIRAAMKGADTAPLSGTVEVDETYIGGKRPGSGSGSHHRYKTAVIGAVQRGGNVRLKVINRVNRRNVRKFINETTQPTTHTIYTDDARVYDSAIHHTVKHDTVKHVDDEWVRADVHTNTVEGVWSLFKRSIVGAYHQVSAKHLPAYLDEFEFRFNRRRRADLFADTIKHLVTAEKMPFKVLTAAKGGPDGR